MSGFKDMVQADIKGVFLNLDEFAELHTVVYDGVTYEGIPMVMSGIKESERPALVSTGGDRIQGLYLVTAVVHFAASDLGGVVPEKGMRISISDSDDGYLRDYRVASSVNELGMIRLELEAIDE
ncbi:MAG TPA: hypothetical protein DCQ13_04185 [Firmicutes bacterium]|jgi:hypothetical protein|nr:hypothetical protein [Bacillota bacterium]